jgi:hypothetical protein
MDSSLKYFIKVYIALSLSLPQGMTSLTMPHSSQGFSAGERTVGQIKS